MWYLTEIGIRLKNQYIPEAITRCNGFSSWWAQSQSKNCQEIRILGTFITYRGYDRENYFHRASILEQRSMGFLLDDRNGAGTFLSWTQDVHMSMLNLRSWLKKERWKTGALFGMPSFFPQIGFSCNQKKKKKKENFEDLSLLLRTTASLVF
jgi:hypothetical protein